jgi:hypothetical protein
MGGVEEDLGTLDREAPAEVIMLLKTRPPASESEAYLLTGKDWQAMCNCVQMLDDKLSELQYISVASKDAMSKHLMGVEDEVGSVLMDLDMGEDAHVGLHINVWSSGVDATLENNQAVANLVGKIAQQVKVTAGNLALVGAKANTETGQLKTHVISLTQFQRTEEAKDVQIRGQLYQ